jgi:flagellar biosynthesis protein FlhA
MQPVWKFISGSKDLTVVMFLIAILSIIIVPLPSAVLDFFLTISLSASVLIILIALFIPRPPDLTTFPTLLLIVVLFRLSLNIATTRMILTEGYQGPEAVSDIITSFGNFVIGGNYVIGIIIFIILVLINFMVVTNGSTRVAEVTARFTLDAMPGRQMAIDADLNAGLIEEEEAKKRRAEILQEADFYGAMDGSSKFVKGDAVAGIIITVVNILAGFLIGMFQHDMDFATSIETFTVLTIGDGLVSQIPALITATATGIIITRGSKDDDNFAEGTINQLVHDVKPLYIVSFILMLFAMVPGLPTMSLGFVALIFFIMAYSIQKTHDGGSFFDFLPSIKNKFSKDAQAQANMAKQKPIGQKPMAQQQASHAPVQKAKKSPEEVQKEEEAAIDDILKVDILELVLGYQLIKLADENQGGDLLDRIRGMRRKMATDYGFITPQVRIRDNLQIDPNYYQILLKGVEIGSGQIEPDMSLAMNNGMVTDEISGIATKEPAFGLDAIWISNEQKEDAIMKGYTVVDPATVVSTHMSELVKNNAEELLTRQDVQTLLDKTKKDYPVIVDDATKAAKIGLIQRVLKELLHERIPIKDMVSILETVADIAEVTQSVEVITEQVRTRLSRVITEIFKDQDGKFKIITLSQATEQYLLSKLQDKGDKRNLLLNVPEINALVQDSSMSESQVLQMGIAPVVMVVDPLIRKALSDIYERFNLRIVVLSHAEIDSSAEFEVLGSVEVNFG